MSKEAMNEIKLVNHSNWRSGPDVGDYHWHRMEFNQMLTESVVVQYLKVHGWLGYNPAGYGNWGFEPINPQPLNMDAVMAQTWVGRHAASCD